MPQTADLPRPAVVVVGAGLIGSFVGGVLASGDADVTFLLREGSGSKHGGFPELASKPFGQPTLRTPVEKLTFTDDPSAVAGADLVLVCVKSSATVDAAARLSEHLPSTTPVVSLQNGMGNVERLRQTLPGARVLGGLVSFNVVSDGPGSYRQTTTGGIHVEEGAPEAVDILRRGGLAVSAQRDIVSLQWGKLLVNLNNALVALSDLPLRDQLGDRRWRLIFVRQVEEARAAMKAAGITPRLPGPNLKLALTLLRLPNFAYRIAAKLTIGVDPKARSSMWEDLAAGRPTEIDELQGAIVRLAASVGRKALLNARVMELVRGVEAGTVQRPLRPEQVAS